MTFPYRVVTTPGHAAPKQIEALSGSGKTAILLGDPQNAAVVKEAFEAAPDALEAPEQGFDPEAARASGFGNLTDLASVEALEAFRRYDEAREPQRAAHEIADILSVAEDIDVEDWFAARREFFEASAALSPRLAERLGVDLGDDAWGEEDDLDDGADDEDNDGDAGPPGMPRELVSHLDAETGEPVKVVAICILPTEKNYETPGLLRFGGWAECPYPAEHVAIWRRWSQRFGATIQAITGDSLEADVSDPPQSYEEAFELAQEFELYCPDLIGELAGSVEDLAKSLIGQTHWFFWWDWSFDLDEDDLEDQ